MVVPVVSVARAGWVARPVRAEREVTRVPAVTVVPVHRALLRRIRRWGAVRVAPAAPVAMVVRVAQVVLVRVLALRVAMPMVAAVAPGVTVARGLLPTLGPRQGGRAAPEVTVVLVVMVVELVVPVVPAVRRAMAAPAATATRVPAAVWVVLVDPAVMAAPGATQWVGLVVRVELPGQAVTAGLVMGRIRRRLDQLVVLAGPGA